MKFLAGYVMRGPTQAILVTAALAMALLPLPPLGYLSGTVVALVALRRGWWSGLMVSGGAAVAVTLFALALFGFAELGLGYLMVAWVPALALALYLRKTVSLPRTLGLAAVFGAAMVLSIYAGTDDPAGYWQKQVEEVFRQAGQPLEKAAELQVLYPWMTGVIASLTTLLLVVTLFIARWWQAQLYNPGGFQSEFHALRFGRVLGIVTLLTVVAGMVGSTAQKAFAGDLLLVYLVLHLLHGIAVVHGLVKKTRASQTWLFAMYALMVPLLPGTVITLAALGFADEWFDFRSFFGNKGEEVR